MKQTKVIKSVCTIITLLIASIIIATIIMIMVYALPVDAMRYHAWISSSNFTEGDHPEWANGLINTQLDCFSDSLIFNTATFKGTGNSVEDAMQNYYVQFENQGIVESYVNSFDNNLYESANKVAYPRYWHGHLAFIKPLLLILTTSEIMVFNMAIQFVLLLLIAIKMSNRFGLKRVVAFMIPILILNPVTVAQSLQYSQVYYILLIHIAIMVCYDSALKRPMVYYLFIMNGVLVAFLDFLTYPIVSLGIPLIFILCVDNRYNSLIEIVKMSVAWGLGYAGMWAGKWIVGSMLTGTNVIENAQTMMGAWTKKVPFVQVLSVNLLPLKNGATMIMLVLLIGYFIFSVRKSGWIRPNIKGSKVVCILLVGLYSVIWYFVLRTHSYIHYWMTFRTYAVAAYAVVSVVTESLSIKDAEV